MTATAKKYDYCMNKATYAELTMPTMLAMAEESAPFAAMFDYIYWRIRLRCCFGRESAGTKVEEVSNNNTASVVARTE